MTNGIAVVEHLRADPNVTSALPKGALGIGHTYVLPGTTEPYIVVTGGDGEEPEYTFGNREAFGSDSVAIFVVAKANDEESEMLMAERVLDLIKDSLQNAESLGYLFEKGRRVLNLRYIGPTQSSLDFVAEGDVTLRAGKRFLIETAPA